MRDDRTVQLLLPAGRMAFITMWRHGNRKCMLVVEAGANPRYSLRIVTGDHIVREEAVTTADQAVATSREWQSDASTAATREIAQSVRIRPRRD